MARPYPSTHHGLAGAAIGVPVPELIEGHLTVAVGVTLRKAGGHGGLADVIRGQRGLKAADTKLLHAQE
jgi:hypothetical protein